MMPGRLAGLNPTIPDNPLGLSWHDSAWIPILNTANVLDYFSERSNPFFDRTCNNEIVKMQRLSPDQLQNMTGLEYVLLHVQEPILYVIRKQHRHSPQQTTPLADYYIIAGVVYQAPDLASVLNSRLLSAVHHLQSSFEEATSFARYHPSKGYSWDFKSQRAATAAGERGTGSGAATGATAGSGGKAVVPGERAAREEPSSLFQRQRVDMLLTELVRRFPLAPPVPQQQQQQAIAAAGTPTATTKAGGTTPAQSASVQGAQATSNATVGQTVQVKQEPDTIVSNTNASTTTTVATAATTVAGTTTTSSGIVAGTTDKDKQESSNDKSAKPPDKKPRLH